MVVVGGGKYVGAVHQLIALDDDDGGGALGLLAAPSNLGRDVNFVDVCMY